MSRLRTPEFLFGKKFGKLTVLGPILSSGRLRILCKCDCGNLTRPSRINVIRRSTTSCGCLFSSANNRRNKTHGKSHFPEYQKWRGMLDRCYSPFSISFPRYGGRGVLVCDRWKNSFESFLQDMGPCGGLSLDRIDVEGNYEPSNCRWATRETQDNNKSKTVYFYYRGERIAQTLLLRNFSIKKTTFVRRIKSGWSLEDALNKPVITRGEPYERKKFSGTFEEQT